MEKASETIVAFLMNKRYIGGKHFPEKKLIVSRTRWLSKEGKRKFEKEYQSILNKGYLIKLKKSTGKGLEWHISLNPEKLKEIYELVENENN